MPGSLGMALLRLMLRPCASMFPAALLFNIVFRQTNHIQHGLAVGMHISSVARTKRQGAGAVPRYRRKHVR